jgi:uncharacterized iron-regulated membrane protein
MSAALQVPQVPSRRQGLRRVWLRLHRWLGLSIGWVLAIVGLLGAVLVVAQPIDRWAHPNLFKAETSSGSGGAAVPLEPLRQRLVAEFGSASVLTFRPPHSADETLWVLVRGKRWSGTVYFDPATGREQGRRGDSEGFVGFTFKLHSSLLLQDTGKAMLAWGALVYLAMLVTGVVLWWPRRWPPSWRIELRQGVLRGLFDLHRTGGIVMGLVIAVSVASGAYMAWRPLGEFVTFLAGGTFARPPVLPKEPKDAPGGPPATVDELAAQARQQFPDDPIGYIQLAGPDRPVRVRMRLADDPHPNGLTSVWLHPRTGAVLSVQRWSDLDPGGRAVAWVYPLHVGELGGLPQQVLTFFSGLALGGLGLTGVWLWWRRRP